VICNKQREMKAFRIKNMANFVLFQYLLCHSLCADVFFFSKLVADDKMPTQYKQP